MRRVAEPLRTSIGARFAINISRTYGLAAVLLDVGVVISTALLTGACYHAWVLGVRAPLEIYATAGALMALTYTSLMASKKGYDVRHRYADGLPYSEMFSAWSLSLLVLLLAGFLTKSTSTYSRGAISIFALVGLGTLLLIALARARFLEWGVRQHLVSLGRVMLVGTQERIEEFNRRSLLRSSGLSIEEVYVLSSGGAAGTEAGDHLAADEHILRRAVERARWAEVDDVLILVPWSDAERIARCGAAFMAMPVRVHVGAEAVLDKFAGLQIESNAGISTLSLARGPLLLSEVLCKRILDVIVSSIALVLLSPLLLAVAVAVRLDSAGPVLFRQRRHGFNQNSFEILKFRSMYVAEDDDRFRQATRHDARVTRIGRILRKTSIDELPQLFNVLMGDMSIVGPRPHPTNLDRAFEPKIALYARRLNVKPGITGWAQVNGLRGETDTNEKMRSRVDYDLYYIEHWSLSFDLYIMARTLLSPRVFVNAY